MDCISIFSPATVANVGCGFDVLGFCLDTIGDIMHISKSKKRGIVITETEGFDLPLDVNKNIAGVSAQALYETLNIDYGFEIRIKKNIKPGSGIGSSAASAVGSVFAINTLLGSPFNKTELIQFALKGEALASQSEHADNLAPALFGGFTLVKSLDPIEILQLPTPNDLYAIVIHPQIEVKTSEARLILPKSIPLQDAVVQWANLGSLIHALHTSDYDLIGRSLKDVIAEPYRSDFIPNFYNLKQIAKNKGALGTSISGSGPSIFSLCKGEKTAFEIEDAQKKLMNQAEIPFESYVSKINKEGIKILP